jgi:hypothetical protein
MGFLSRAASGAPATNRLLTLQGGTASGPRFSSTPSSGPARVTPAPAGGGGGQTLVDAYFQGIDREWSRLTGQPASHSQGARPPVHVFRRQR